MITRSASNPRLEAATLKLAASYGKSGAGELPKRSKAQDTLRYMLGKGRGAAEHQGARAESDLARTVEATMVDAIRRAL